MVEKEPQNEQTKEINGVTITNLEISKIAMICDYLVLDRFNDISSFIRFEKCFGPLLNKEDPNFLIEVFQEICGPKKKYISFGRLISAYIKWKTNSSQNDNFNKFMNTVFNSMIKTQDEVIGKLEEGTRIFSTRNTRGRKVISKFSVFTDSPKNCIQGFNIQYDDFFDSLLCTKKKEGEDKNINLEINFPPNGKTILDRDGISHIAGKFSVTNNVIKFLIFKCRSGKTLYIGDNSEEDGEKIDLFIFGTSSCQLKTLRIETINDKLAYIEPKFQPSMRVNQKIISFDLIDEKYINDHIINSQLIFEENEIQNVPIENLDQKTLLIPCINDDAFMEKESLEEKIGGKDYHEVYKCFLEREKEEKEGKKDEEEKEKEELKKSLIEKTVQRVSLLKFYSKKFKNKENLMVLKNKNINIQEDERVNMDKYLAKIKFFRKKVDKRKELGKKEEKENVEEELEQDEDWVDNEKKEYEEKKKEEKKEEEKKEDEKVEEIKEEEKKEDEKVEEIKEEEKKENEKAEEIKEDEKIEEIKEEEIKGENIEEEIKGENKEEEIKENENLKEEDKKEDVKIEENKEDEIKEENKVEDNKENENNTDEDKKEENNNINIEENKEKNISEYNKITIESNEINEINIEENDKKEEKIRLRGKQPKRLKRKQQNEIDNQKIEDKKEGGEEEKNEEKINNKIEDKIEDKKENKNEIFEIKEKTDKIEDKKENENGNNKLDNYESNKIEDLEEKKEKQYEKNEEVQQKKTFCSSCIMI